MHRIHSFGLQLAMRRRSPERASFTAFVALAAVFLLVSRACAENDTEQLPAAAEETPQDTVVQASEFKRWLSNASCVSCHFHVPHQSATDHWKSAMVEKGYLADSYRDSHPLDVHKQKAGGQCGKCHTNPMELTGAGGTGFKGECTRGDGCLRNAGQQTKVTYLGVSVGAVPSAVRQHVKLPKDIGLMIESVEPDSPAAHAELRPYDILKMLDRQLLVNQEQFSTLIKTYQPGQEIALTVIRANEPKEVQARLGERVTDEARLTELTHDAIVRALDLQRRELEVARILSDAAELTHQLERVDQPSRGLVTYLGVNTSPPSEALVEQLKLPKGFYLLIDSVEPDSPAATAGLRAFDLLQRLDDQLLVNSEQLTVLIRNRRAGDEVDLTLVREGQPLKLRARLGEHRLSDAVEQQETGLVLADVGNNGSTATSLAMLALANATLSDVVDLSIRNDDVKDEDYVRRVYLDLTGTPPSDRELAVFVADDRPNKRQRLIDRLLSRPDVIDRVRGNAVLEWSDAEHSLVLTTTEAGQKRLLAKDTQAKVLFDGPVESEEQRQQLGPRLAAKLELMLKGLAASPASDAPADSAAALEKILPRFEADGETLAQLLDRLRHETGANIVVDRKALAAAGVKLDEPLSLNLHEVRVRSVLKTVLALAGGRSARLVYEVEDGVVLITSAH